MNHSRPSKLLAATAAKADGLNPLRNLRPVRRAATSVLVTLGLLTSTLGLVPGVSVSAAEAAVPTPGPGEAVVTVKVAGDRNAGATVAGLAGVTLALHGPGSASVGSNNGVNVNQGASGPRYDAAWSWTTCTSDANGDCSFVIPIRPGTISDTGVPEDTRFWVVQETTPGGWYDNPQMRVGENTAAPEFTWDYRFRTDVELRAGVTYRSTTALAPDASWTDSAEPDRGFMRNREDNWEEGDYASNVGRTTGVWSQSRTNPPLPATCGLKIALVTDTSGSLGASGLAELKAAMGTFVDAFSGTPTQMSLYSFSNVSPGNNATNHPALLPVTTAAQASAFKAQYASWSYGGGTNWDQGFVAAADSGIHYDMVVLLTDGNPTMYGTNPIDNASAINSLQDVDAGILAANQLKAQGTRVLAMGAGPALTPESELNLRAVSGVVEDSDYFRAANFTDAAGILAALAEANCQGSIQVQKLIVPSGGTVADATPAPAGWEFNANGVASGVSVVAPNSATTTSGGNGTVNFGLGFTSPTTSGAVRVLETQQPGYQVLPVGNQNATCINANTGAAVSVTNAGTAANPGFDVTGQARAQIECKIYNTLAQSPGMEFSKTADASGIQNPSVVGDQITYTFTSKNTGNVPLTGVTINDPLAGLSALTYNWPGTPGTLLPNESVTATATYAITQADIDAGHVANSATTTGNPPTGPPVTPPPGTTDTPLTPAPAMEFTKTADASGIQNPSVVGDQITYTFTSTNTGNVKLTGVTINDPLAGLSALAYVWPGTPGELLPGQSVTATATYAITQADIEAGHVANTATT
ncbi:VWA domain-containing protein, partial [Paenarthrobacter sp. NPDC056912]|uniref:DUF7507 domain-containing protein n=1 Tax=Paenarthrobacter sp. NPDC056912 TaxID=3345965 RepID=UPI00366DE225